MNLLIILWSDPISNIYILPENGWNSIRRYLYLFGKEKRRHTSHKEVGLNLDICALIGIHDVYPDTYLLLESKTVGGGIRDMVPLPPQPIGVEVDL